MKNEDKIIFAIIAITVVFGLFKKMGPSITAENVEKTKTEINLSIDRAEQDLLKKEIDNNEPVACECTGTGFIVHGDGHKTPCPAGDNCKAKKKIKTTTMAPEKKNGVISFYTLPGCIPCEKWKIEVKPWVEDSNWNVEEFDSESSAPWFEVWIDGKSYVYKGFMSKEAFKEIVKNAQK